MKHLGDITKINGHDVPLVDIVTGGSPCQDLSVAGKRAGLEGERSGLFMEQIRIVKEMRDESIKQLQLRGADVDIRLIKPRFMVWENVPGAFSSNHGEDFRCVLEEICRIADKATNVPIPRGGKWSTSGCIMGDWWSIAWRLHDAQFWGVPQRRKRIALVADFGGESAPEILFESKSVSWNIKKSKEKKEEIAGTIGKSTKKTIGRIGCFYPQMKAESQCYREDGVVNTLVNGTNPGFQNGVVYEKNTFTMQAIGEYANCGVSSSLKERDYKDATDLVVYGIDRASFNQGENAKYDFSVQEEIAQPLLAKGPGGVLTQLGHYAQETTKE